MSVECRSIWCAGLTSASPLDRRTFLASGAAREPLLAKLDGPHRFIDAQYEKARPSTLGFAVVPDAGHGFISDRAEEALGIFRPWLDRQDRG